MLSWLRPESCRNGELHMVAWYKRHKTWLLLGASFAVIAIILALASDVPAFLYHHYYRMFVHILYQRAGFSRAWSKFGAVLIAIVYVLIFPYFFKWFYRGHTSGYHKVVGALAAAVILATPPLIEALFPTNFNQHTGSATGCYVISDTGVVKLTDSCGYDPVTGQMRRRLTREIAKIYERQEHGLVPRRITMDPSRIGFFNPVTGRARVWYERRSDGSIELFNMGGFSPDDSQRLRPITPDLAKQLRRDARRADEQAKLAAQREAQQANLAAQRQAAQATLEARQRAEQEARIQKEKRAARLGVSLEWASAQNGMSVIEVISVGADSPLAGRLFAGDTIIQVDHHPVQRGGDPRNLLNADLAANSYLDLLVERDDAVYSVLYRP